MNALSLAPFQQPTGLAPREAVAHLQNHIEKITKKHASLKEVLSHAEVVARKHLTTVSETMFVTSASAALGLVNGRYGGEKGFAAPYGIPVDAATAVVAHAVAFSGVLGDEVSGALHAVGDAAIGVGIYRIAHNKGVELAQRATALAAATAGVSAQANGARGGAVYNVAPPAPRT